MSLQPDCALDQACAWFRTEAQRYVALAQGHTEQADLMAAKAASGPMNDRRRGQYRSMAFEAAMTAQRYLEIAIALRTLQLGRGVPAPGSETRLPVTYLRPCGPEEGLSSEGLFRLQSGDVVRAALAPFMPLQPAQIGAASA